MLELTISKKGEIPIILGIEGVFIKYKKENGNKIETNPLNLERIIIYSKDWDKEISITPKIGFYPIIVKTNKNKSYCPGEVIEIKEIIDKTQSLKTSNYY